MTVESTQNLSLADEETESDVVWGRLVPKSGSNQVFELIGDEIKFGRDKQQVDHEMMEPQISSLHCAVQRLKGSNEIGICCEVKDHSTNGTFINGTKIGKGNTQKMFDGDELIFIQQKTTFAKGDTKKGGKLSFNLYMVKHQEMGGINDKYELRATLGTGSFAVVKLGINRLTGEEVAVKQVDKKKYKLKSRHKNPDSIKNECQILQRINHKNIIKIYDVFETDDTLYLVLEMASGGDLFQRILDLRRLPENIVRKVMWQLLSAIKYLHDHKIAHRDLKPENVLLKEAGSWEIKIADFGLSRCLKVQKETLTTLCGTPMFLAPEVLSTECLKGSGYGFEVDYWSMGVIMYCMLVGHPPYNEKDGRLLELVKSGKFVFPHQTWRTVSPTAKDLVVHLMEPSPQKRFGWKDVYTHAWMNEEPRAVPRREEFGLSLRTLSGTLVLSPSSDELASPVLPPTHITEYQTNNELSSKNNDNHQDSNPDHDHINVGSQRYSRKRTRSEADDEDATDDTQTQLGLPMSKKQRLLAEDNVITAEEFQILTPLLSSPETSERPPVKRHCKEVEKKNLR